MKMAFPEEEAVLHHFWFHPIWKMLGCLNEQIISITIFELNLLLSPIVIDTARLSYRFDISSAR